MVAGAFPAEVPAALMEGVLKAMLMTKNKIVMNVLMLGVMVSGGGLLTQHTAEGQQTEKEQDRNKPANRQVAKTDLDRLQGVWAVVSIERRGGKPSKLDKAVFMVDGKRACWQTSDSEIQGGLYLETSTNPKAYDLAMITRTIEGIYSLDNDTTLRLCYDLGIEAKRPDRFATEKGSQQVLVLLKRIHGREVFPFRLADGTRAFPKRIEREE
jgi:uncharacterized protein (TIGR03067 family)